MKGCGWGVTCGWGGEGCSSSHGEVIEVVEAVVESRLVLVLPAMIWIAATEDEGRRLEGGCQAIVALWMVVVVGEVGAAEPEGERVCPWWLTF